MKYLQIFKVLGGTLTTRNKRCKSVARSGKKSKLPADVPSGATADRAAKHYLQDAKYRGTPKRISFVSDEPSEMIRKEARSSEDFKKLVVVKQDRNVFKNKQAGCKDKTTKMDQYLSQWIAK